MEASADADRTDRIGNIHRDSGDIGISRMEGAKMINFILGAWFGASVATFFLCCFKLKGEEHETD